MSRARQGSPAVRAICTLSSPTFCVAGMFDVKVIEHTCNPRTAANGLLECVETTPYDVVVTVPFKQRVTDLHTAAQVVLSTLQTELAGTPGFGERKLSVRIDVARTFHLWLTENESMKRMISSVVRWSPRILGLRDQVLAGMQAELGHLQYNGVHLRLEGDAGLWQVRLGGR